MREELLVLTMPTHPLAKKKRLQPEDLSSLTWRSVGPANMGGRVAAIGQGLIASGPMVGASGAIAGVLGAYLIMSPAARISTLVFLGLYITILELPAVIVIGMFIVLQLIEGFAELRMSGHAAAQQVAYFAHITGFAAGLLLLTFFRRGQQARRMRFG